MFTDKEHRGPFEFSDEIGNLSIGVESAEAGVPGHSVEANDKDLLLSTSEKEETRGPSTNGAYSAPYDSSLVSLAASHTLPDLMSSNTSVLPSASQSSFAIDDLLGLGVSATPAPAPAPAPSPPPLKLNSKASLDASTFQQKWRQLPISISQVHCANNSVSYLPNS